MDRVFALELFSLHQPEVLNHETWDQVSELKEKHERERAKEQLWGFVQEPEEEERQIS